MGSLLRMFRSMRSAFVLICLFLTALPAGALAGDPLWTYAAPAEVACLSLTPDGSHVLLGGERVCLLAGDGTPLWEEWSAGMTACSADGQVIAGAGGLQLALYAGDARVLWRKTLSSDCVALALSPDGKRIVVADLLGEVHVYDADGTLRTTADTRGDPEDEVQSRVHALALGGKGTSIAVASSRGLFSYTGTGKRLWAHEGRLEGGTAVAVSGTGDEVAVASDAGVRLLNRTGGLIWTHPSRRPVTALALAEDGSRVLAAAQDNTLVCIDREGETRWTFTAGGWIRDVAVSKDGSRVLAGSMDRQAYLFDGAGRLLGTYALDGWVNHVALTADGTAGVASSSRRVIGISTAAPAAAETVGQTTAVPTTPPHASAVDGDRAETVGQTTPVPTTAALPVTTTVPAETVTTPPLETETPDPLLPLLIAGLLAGGVGYHLHRRRRQAPAPEEKTSPLPEERGGQPAVRPPEEEAPPRPWEAPLAEGRTREAARVLSRQMTALIAGQTGARVLSTADAQEACPARREELARFYAEADRLAYAPPLPEREEVEALAAAYLRIAGEIR